MGSICAYGFIYIYRIFNTFALYFSFFFPLLQKTSNEFFDMGIFVAFFVLIAIVCLLLLLKLRWRQKRKQVRCNEYYVLHLKSKGMKNILRELSIYYGVEPKLPLSSEL